MTELTDVQQLLVTTLRDPSIKQGTQFLAQLINNTPCYCVMGVACKLLEDKLTIACGIPADCDNYIMKFNENCASAPKAVVDYFGFNDGFGALLRPLYWSREHNVINRTINTPDVLQIDSLSQLNDAGASLELIADVIESYPELVFKQA